MITTFAKTEISARGAGTPHVLSILAYTKIKHRFVTLAIENKFSLFEFLPVAGEGFEPPKENRLIYSQMHLAALQTRRARFSSCAFKISGYFPAMQNAIAIF